MCSEFCVAYQCMCLFSPEVHFVLSCKRFQSPSINHYQSLDLYCAIPQLCSWRISIHALDPEGNNLGHLVTELPG